MADETPATEGPKQSVVKSRHVVSHAISTTTAAGSEAASQATEGAPVPNPRNNFRISLAPMKQRHDTPGKKKTPSYMSDL